MQSMKYNARPARSIESGSVIFFILIGVALFAALSFAVGNMLRQGNPQAIGEEKSRLYAQEIMTYANALREAVRDVRISSGCADTDISFENPSLTGYGHTPAARTACRVYDAAGGAMTYAAPPADWLDAAQSAQSLYGKIYVTGRVCIPGIGQGDNGSCASDGTDNEDLVLFVPYIRAGVCAEINEMTGAGSDGDPPPVESGDGWQSGSPPFTGSFTDGVSLDQDGRMNGCFEGDTTNLPGGGTYHFFQVLLAR